MPRISLEILLAITSENQIFEIFKEISSKLSSFILSGIHWENFSGFFLQNFTDKILKIEQKFLLKSSNGFSGILAIVLEILRRVLYDILLDTSIQQISPRMP